MSYMANNSIAVKQPYHRTRVDGLCIAASPIMVHIPPEKKYDLGMVLQNVSGDCYLPISSLLDRF